MVQFRHRRVARLTAAQTAGEDLLHARNRDNSTGEHRACADFRPGLCDRLCKDGAKQQRAQGVDVCSAIHRYVYQQFWGRVPGVVEWFGWNLSYGYGIGEVENPNGLAQYDGSRTYSKMDPASFVQMG